MTITFLIYLAKVALSMLLLIVLFRVALAADQSFARNRFYLLGAALWSVIIPMLTIQGGTGTAITPTYIVNLPEVVITANGPATETSAWGDPYTIILTIYLTGVVIFLARMLGAYARVLYIIATAKNRTIDSDNIKVTRAAIAPFTFFGWIVFPEKLIDHRDLTKMLLHERVHSRQLHSIDLLLGELFAVFQWFNPASWMLKKMITENHEYTADRAVIDLGVSTYEYQASLVNATVGREVVPVSHFSLILIKKRIKMMNKNRNSVWLRAKVLLVPVAFIGALTLTSFTVEQSISSSSTIIEPIIEKAEKITFTPPVIKKDEPKQEIKFTPPVIKKDEDLSADDQDEVFQAVEQMPYFGKNKKVSTKAMMDFLTKNMKYPEEAMKKNIQGSVFVQFTVKKDGSLTGIKIIRGVDPLLDNEAIRVTKQMPKWTPGRQNGKTVNVAFTMPVKFMLVGDNADKSVPKKLSEVKADYSKSICVVNGKEYTGDRNLFSPDDIKEITILKGKSATDLYGEKGKYGVILITLKEGKSVSN